MIRGIDSYSFRSISLSGYALRFYSDAADLDEGSPDTLTSCDLATAYDACLPTLLVRYADHDKADRAEPRLHSSRSHHNVFRSSAIILWTIAILPGLNKKIREGYESLTTV